MRGQPDSRSRITGRESQRSIQAMQYYAGYPTSPQKNSMGCPNRCPGNPYRTPQPKG